MRRLLLVTVDIVLIAIATVGALLLRDNFETTLQRLGDFMIYLSATLTVASVVLPTVGLDRSIWRFTSLADGTRLALAAFSIVTGAVAISFAVNRMDSVARAVPFIQGILMVALMLGVRVVVRLRHLVRAKPPQLTGMVADRDSVVALVVGLGPLTDVYLRAITDVGQGKIRIAGVLGRTDRHVGRLIGGHQIRGTPEQAEEVIRDLVVHGVIVRRIDVTVPFGELSAEARSTLLRLERDEGIRLEVVAERLIGLGHYHADPPEHPGAGTGAGTPGVDHGNAFHLTPELLQSMARRPYWRVKRIVDVCAATVLLVLLSPLFMIVALLVAIDVGLPVTFWQERPGLAGRPFRVNKFRTMSAAHDHAGRTVPDQDRISPIGRLLRRTRLDELPQLLQIIKGDMSFVGPRPLLPIDQRIEHSARLLVRPGLTGWAQVKGGREISPSDKAALDVWYVSNASLALDIEILARTVQLVLRGERVDRSSVDRAWRELASAGICHSVSEDPRAS